MLGWGLVAATVAAYDAYALVRKCDTLCAVARRHPVVVGSALVTFVIHLWPIRRRGADTQNYL